jgi:hypothetical protein
VDFDRLEVAIKRTVWRARIQEHPKTDSSEASLPIPGPLAEVLKQHKDSSRWAGEEDFVFARADGLHRIRTIFGGRCLASPTIKLGQPMHFRERPCSC